MIVVLHNIRSAHNVGSIFRTADAVGCQRVYLCGITPLPLDRFGRPNSKIAKVALGAENYLSWKQVVRTTSLIDKLKLEGYKILALEQHAKSKSFYGFKIKSSSKVALILGSEVKGLPASILKRADTILEIPMRGKKESLNVSVAFGIVAFQLLRGK